MCINCGCAGNFRSECEAPPRCPSTLAYLWYGTEGGSFYYVDAEIEEEAVRLHLVTIALAPEQVLSTGVVISADLIQAELAAYIGDFRDSDFAWEVIETAPLVFSVPFPSAALLRVCSHDLIRCPINKFMISVHAAVAEPDPVPPLEKVWVLVYGLPRGGRSAPRGGKLAHILKAISEPVGKLVTTDLAYFEDDGPPALRSSALLRQRLMDGDEGSSGESSFCEEEDDDVGVPPVPSDGRHSPISTGDGSSGHAGAASRVASGVETVAMDAPSCRNPGG
ncbi:hypothetical protein ZWY2020_016011 [Hordeum vulgare]|nr:hypothetical protein ZWY2020_016011 [Hordeum vulgare]